MKFRNLKQTGFSTLEALAALMLLNLLCVGMLNLQMQALQAQRDARAIQTAIALAQDLWERMSINPQAALSYQLVLGQTISTLDCQNQACTTSAWAQSDLAAWQAMVQLRLPGAQTQLMTNTQSHVQLLLAWPVKDATTSLSPAIGDCPAAHRCWQTGWTL